MASLGDRIERQRVVRAKRIKVIFGIILAIMMFAATAAFWFISGGNFDKAKRTVGSIVGTDKVNIMVMGVDERGDDAGRSDTLFIISVDKNTKSVSMLSIPRDTRVNIPGHGFDKINHAYAFGGHRLTQQAVEGLLGMPIDYYMMINISGFKKIVDAIGGVDINVEKRMVYDDPYDDNGGLHIDLRPGLQHMNGETAIQYVRYRDEEGDIGRVARQQKFVRAVLTQVAGPSIITKLPGIISGLTSTIKTDLSTSEMLNLAKLVNDASKQGMKADMVPGKPGYINEVSYWLPDIVELREHLAKSLGITMDEKYVKTARNEATVYEKSIPKEMKIIEPPKKDAKTEEKAPGKITIEIVNASGSADAGNKMAAMLRAQGLEVIGISSTSSLQKSTTVISNTDNAAVVNKLKNMPFPYSLQVFKGDGKGTVARVILGKDFAGNEAAKETSKEQPSKEQVKEPVKEPIKDTPKEPIRQPAVKQ